MDRSSALNVVAAIKSKIPFEPGLDKSFEECLQNIFLMSIARYPQWLSSLGLFEALDVREYNAYLDDLSVESLQQNLITEKNCLKRLQQYDLASLNPEQQISYQIVAWKLEHALAGEKFLLHGYYMNQLDSFLSGLTYLFTMNHKLEKLVDFANYLTRLRQIPVQVQQTISLCEVQLAAKCLPPRLLVEQMIKLIQASLTERVQEHNFFMHFAKEAAKKTELFQSEQLLTEAELIIEKQVYPALRSLIKYLSNLLPEITDNNGVWALPNGDQYYAYILKYHTTTDLTPAEIHAIGLQEVGRIQVQVRELLAQLGVHDDSKLVTTLMQEVMSDPAQFYSNDETGRQACLRDFEQILARSRQSLNQLFDIKPATGVEIKAVPKHEESGQAGAYYCMPSLDGSRPGTFFVNLRNMKEVPKYHMETLLIHEAEPGHHFQLAIQCENDLPFLRKIYYWTAYGEGWALYAEKLADEHHFYSSPLARLGHLQDELLRAARLVIDTGIHYKRWTRDQAIKYMIETTGYHPDSAVTEVERYFVLPGQACAYKIGQLKILELRERAKAALGKRFKLHEFHNVVLTLGAAPLVVLELVVEQYIKRLSGQNA